MLRSGSGPEVVQDTSHAYVRRSSFGASAGEWHNFMSPNLVDMYGKPKSRGTHQLDSEDEEMDIRKILKDIEYLGSSNMSWKERKKLENRNVVALGGKPPKKQRLPLSVAKVPMKRQKQREQKKLEEELFLGRYGKKHNNTSRREKFKPVDTLLKASEGHFKKGVLNVNHLLRPSQPENNDNALKLVKGRKKGKGKKGKKKRH